MRPVIAGDEAFLFRVYAGVRGEEVAAWGWDLAQVDAFLRMQFTAQNRWYASQYPGAEHSLILCDEEPAGRLMVLETGQEIRLVDISLLPQFRNRGIGRSLLAGLIEEARTSGRPVRLHVLKNNPALRLYQRLGFSITADAEPYWQMERLPS